MAKVEPFNVLIEQPDPELENSVAGLLRENHGAHGLRLIDPSVLEGESAAVRLTVRQDTEADRLSFTYRDAAGEIHVDTVPRTGGHTEAALSRFAVRSIVIPPEGQSSRPDFAELAAYSGDRPNLEADPSSWIVGNPFIADLCRRFPEYGNLVRYLVNERGMFLKVGNHPNQRAYWNSTLNGGLPVFKKADPIHEGTFMLHDMFHFVPVDPILGAGHIDDGHKAAYIGHRMLSEASTLVLADMVAVADARLDQTGYDVTKRKIFPVYQSIAEARGKAPDVDKLLAANAYFCFTGDSEGFRIMGAAEDALEDFQGKYESIFRNDFMWNMQNFDAMLVERQTNPAFADYYRWLEANTPFPTLKEHEALMLPGSEGLDIARLLSLFRADFTNALGYQQPINDTQRRRLAYQKYLAGQRAVFARFGHVIDPGKYLEQFDGSFAGVAHAGSTDEISQAGQAANSTVDAYIQALEGKGILLPHEAALYRFSVPLYPIKFINYEKDKQGTADHLADTMQQFLHVNERHLQRLLEAVAA